MNRLIAFLIANPVFATVGIGSKVELVARLIDFYRANLKMRGSLDNLDRAIDTFEKHH